MDRTDNDDLLSVLERICLEHRVMKALLHADKPDSWRHDVSVNLRSVGFLNKQNEQFREVKQFRETHDNPPPNNAGEMLRVLTQALNQTNLDDDPSWNIPLEL